MPRNRANNIKEQLRAREREDIIWEYRLQGMSCRAIAVKVGMSPSGVAAACKRVAEDLKEHSRSLAEHWTELELERLDAMQATWYERAVKYGDLEGILVLLKIHAARCKLLGLGAPEAHTISAPGGGPVAFKGVSTEELLERLPDALSALGTDSAAEAARAIAGVLGNESEGD